MARQNPKNPTQGVKSSLGTEESAADLFAQMETLQRELLVLAQRAQAEVENALANNPAPVLEMLKDFAGRTAARSGSVWFGSSRGVRTELAGLKALELDESDKLQCDLALSGREMSFDFVQTRVFFPIVVFENPLAVAVFDIPGLSCSNYEEVCRHASRGIGDLRTKLKPTNMASKSHFNVAS